MLKSAVRMREMLFQRHKFQKISKGGVSPDPPSWTRLRVPCLEAACSSFAPGGKSACYASVNSEYTYRDFLKTPGFTALPYAKIVIFAWYLLNFVGEFWNKHPPSRNALGTPLASARFSGLSMLKLQNQGRSKTSENSFYKSTICFDAWQIIWAK